MQRQPYQLVSGSLAASCFIAVTQIISRGGDVPATLHYAVLLFAIAIPFLIALSLTRFPEDKWPPPKGELTLLFVSWLIALAGLTCLFWYFSGWYAAVFLAASLVAVIAMWKMDHRTKHIKLGAGK